MIKKIDKLFIQKKSKRINYNGDKNRPKKTPIKITPK